MAEDCVKFIEKDAGRPAIQVLPKSGSVAPVAVVKPSDDTTSVSSLNSAAFVEVVVAPADSKSTAAAVVEKKNMPSIGSGNVFAIVSNNIQGSPVINAPTTNSHLQHPHGHISANNSNSNANNWWVEEEEL